MTLIKRGWALLVLVGVGSFSAGAEAKPYKGAEIYTQAQYKYGRVEVRMRAAKGEGVLSTFFTYKPGSEGAGVAWEEIDVEIFGKSNANSWQSNILVGNPRMGSEQVHQVTGSLADAYHTYTIEWTPTAVVWLLDGVEVRRTTGGQTSQLTTAHNFRFNLWASDVSSWAGAFVSSVLPQYQYVNWIRYYRYDNGNFVLDWSDDFTTLDAARWSKANWTFDGNLVDFDPNNATVKDGTLVLCMTAEGQTGCSGAVPVDPAGSAGAGGGGSGGGGGGSGGAAGAGGAAGSGGAPTAGSGGAAGNGGSAGGGAASGGAAGGGSPATGGAPALGGAPGTAGASSGGAPGTAGAPGSGGAAGSGMAPNGAGNGGTTPGSGDSGCGCMVAGGGGSGGIAAVLGLLLGGQLLRRRRRSRSV